MVVSSIWNIGTFWNDLTPSIDLTEESVSPHPGQILSRRNVTLWSLKYNSWYRTYSSLVLGEIPDKRPEGSGYTIVEIRLKAEGLGGATKNDGLLEPPLLPALQQTAEDTLAMQTPNDFHRGRPLFFEPGQRWKGTKPKKQAAREGFCAA